MISIFLNVNRRLILCVDWIVPVIRHVQLLTPSTSECDLIWKLGLCRNTQVTMRSYWIRIGPKSTDWCPYNTRRGHRKTYTKGIWKLEWCSYKPRNAKDYEQPQKLHRVRGRILLELSEEHTPANSLILDF